MLAHKLCNLDYLIKYFRKLLSLECIKYNLKPLPTEYRINFGGVAGFDSIKMVFCIDPNLVNKFKIQHETMTVFDINRLVAHEVHHYLQYVRKAEKNKYSEIYSDRYGIYTAAKAIRKMSNDEINPTMSNDNPASSLYQSFHGNPPAKKIKVYFEPPEGDLVKIGDLSEIKYKPTGPSQHKGIEFFHKSGDTGEHILDNNLILCTDKDGKNLYLVKKNKNIKRPYFSDRGIIG